MPEGPRPTQQHGACGSRICCLCHMHASCVSPMCAPGARRNRRSRRNRRLATSLETSFTTALTQQTSGWGAVCAWQACATSTHKMIMHECVQFERRRVACPWQACAATRQLALTQRPCGALCPWQACAATRQLALTRRPCGALCPWQACAATRQLALTQRPCGALCPWQACAGRGRCGVRWTTATSGSRAAGSEPGPVQHP